MADQAPYVSQNDEEPLGALDNADQALAVAEYLVDMIAQLESMARIAGLDLVSYLLSMARSEAQMQARARPS